MSNYNQLLPKLLDKGFILTLVGGAVRDYFLKGELPLDLDFEIRHKDAFSGDEWEKKIDKIFEEFHSIFIVAKNPYCVYKLTYEESSLEFASPRMEKFDSTKHDHKNFTAEIFSNLDYEESLKRRDFSLNALGVEISKADVKFIDVFDGITHLKNNELFPCGDDFYKDPVRLLRAVRFKTLMGFNFSEKLLSEFKKMNLTSISAYHVRYEVIKSKSFGEFFNSLSLIIKESAIPISGKLSFLTKLNFDQKNKFTTFQTWFASQVYFDRFDEKDIGDLCSFFGFSLTEFKNIAQYIKLAKEFNLKLFLETYKKGESEFIKSSICESIILLNRYDENYHFSSLLEEFINPMLPQFKSFAIALLGESESEALDFQDFIEKNQINPDERSAYKLYFKIQPIFSLFLTK